MNKFEVYLALTGTQWAPVSPAENLTEGIVLERKAHDGAKLVVCSKLVDPWAPSINTTLTHNRGKTSSLEKKNQVFEQKRISSSSSDDSSSSGGLTPRKTLAGKRKQIVSNILTELSK